MVDFTFHGFTTGETVALSVAQGPFSDSGAVPGWGLVPAFSVGEADGEPVVTYGSGGSVSITVAGGIYAGTYTTDHAATPLTTTLIEAGPVCLVLGDISGTTGVGDTLSYQPALWIYAGDDPGAPSYRWKRGGSAIGGALDLAHTVVSGDQGTSLTVSETLGGVTVTSAGTGIPVPTIATDAGALWHSDHNSWVASGTDVTSIGNDKVGTGAYPAMDSLGTMSAPQWAGGAADPVTFSGTQGLYSSTTFNDHMKAYINDAGETLVFMMVIRTYGAVNKGAVLCENYDNNGNGNYCTTLGFDTTGGTSDIQIFRSSKAGSNAYGTVYSKAATTHTTPSGLMLLEAHVSPTTAEFYINGSLEYSEAVTPANFPGFGYPMHMGMGAVAGAAGYTNGCIYDFHEGLITTSVANAATFRAELNARWSIY